jgi:hypothetical protein
MNLNDRNFPAVLIDVLIERHESRLVRLDERHEVGNTRPLCFELSLLEPVGCYEDERLGHRDSFRSIFRA